MKSGKRDRVGKTERVGERKRECREYRRGGGKRVRVRECFEWGRGEMVREWREGETEKGESGKGERK